MDLKSFMGSFRKAKKPGMVGGILLPVAVMSAYLGGKKMFPSDADIALEKIKQRGERYRPLSATSYLPSKLHQTRIFEDMFRKKVL